MNTIDDVRLYFGSIVSGARRPFSLVNNQSAFDCLRAREDELMVWAGVLSIDYNSIRKKLTSSAADAARIELYVSMSDLLNETI